jgi:hypothetical protein
VAGGTAERLSAAVALALATATLAVAIVFSTSAAGGSDSSCYVLQAIGWADGTLLRPPPLPFDPPWPDPARAFAPTGFLPSETIPGGIAPICPPGLSLLMALAWKVGGLSALFLVVPVLGALAVFLTYLLGAELGGPVAGIASAVLVAASPIVLYQVVQPMSDVPAMALWLLTLVLVAHGGRARDAAAGVATSMAVLTRPNLAPLAAVIAVFLLWRPKAEDRLRRRLVPTALFVAGTIPGLLALGWIQFRLYGSPFRSGYGSLGPLFALSHVWPNLARYPAWFIATHTPLPLIGLLAPFVLAARDRREATEGSARRLWLACLSVAMAALVTCAYLLYVPFDEWWFLRFLLPALPPIFALSSVVLVAASGWLPGRGRTTVVLLVCAALAAVYINTARARFAFNLRADEQRFVRMGEFVGERLPEQAVILAIWHSGSARLYGRRLTLAWDAIDPAWLDRAVEFLESRGRPVYVLAERWEEDNFRKRFERYTKLGALDWPPSAALGLQLRLYAVADRARYYAGESIQTDQVGGRR